MTRGLAVRELRARRAGSLVLDGCTLEAPPASITVLLGANGAGKTSLLDALSGLLEVEGGTVELAGVDVTRATRRRRSLAGLAHVEQGRSVFTALSVEENLAVAARAGGGDAEEAYALFPELRSRRSVAAGRLSGGEQQMLVLARALQTRPEVLLIDEMSLGLAPRIVHQLLEVLGELARSGMAVLLVEQFAALALRAGDQAYVLQHGRIVFAGACSHLLEDEHVLRDAYLGRAGAAT